MHRVESHDSCMSIFCSISEKVLEFDLVALLFSVTFSIYSIIILVIVNIEDCLILRIFDICSVKQAYSQELVVSFLSVIINVSLFHTDWVDCS